jgi:hypothetical protein
LKWATEKIASVIGYRSVPGGPHVGRGTINRLLRLGTDSYLELLGRDPEPGGAAWITPEKMGFGRLVGWALRSTDIERDAAELRRSGFDPGLVSAMQRASPQGLLQWRCTETNLESGVAPLPFLIDWGASTHPTASLPAGPELLSLRVQMPNPERLNAIAQRLGSLLVVESAEQARLEAVVRAADGNQISLSELEPEGAA